MTSYNIINVYLPNFFFSKRFQHGNACEILSGKYLTAVSHKKNLRQFTCVAISDFFDAHRYFISLKTALFFCYNSSVIT